MRFDAPRIADGGIARSAPRGRERHRGAALDAVHLARAVGGRTVRTVALRRGFVLRVRMLAVVMRGAGDRSPAMLRRRPDHGRIGREPEEQQEEQQQSHGGKGNAKGAGQVPPLATAIDFVP